jgi:hypothetical protein
MANTLQSIPANDPLTEPSILTFLKQMLYEGVERVQCDAS